jgi:hypothetical protein
MQSDAAEAAEHHVSTDSRLAAVIVETIKV